ncbi:hypothetical protein F4679DRAFT_595703 [Xylaria curta]|nr:hypothetical protein F4679DRAFT_595703 [Xylaria curta]
MSDQNSRQRGIKRERDQSPDSEIKNEIVSRRNRANQNHSPSSLATCQRIEAAYTVEGLDGRRTTFPGQPTASAFKAEAAATIDRYSDDTVVVWTASRLNRRNRTIDPVTNPRGYRVQQLEEQGRRNRFERSASAQSRRTNQTVVLQEAPGCKICKGNHHPRECIHLNMTMAEFNQTTRGFRVVCPFHKRPHPMDECNQLHLWAADPDQVHRLLITDAANAPAFATNLISWPDIVKVTDNAFPWSAEYSHTMWKDNMMVWFMEQGRGVITTDRGPDPDTSEREDVADLPPQTLNGRAPQFSSLEQLANYAKELTRNLEEQKFQTQILSYVNEMNAQFAEIDSELEKLQRNHAEAVRAAQVKKVALQEQHAQKIQAALEAHAALSGAFQGLHVDAAAQAPTNPEANTGNTSAAEDRPDVDMHGTDSVEQSGPQNQDVKAQLPPQTASIFGQNISHGTDEGEAGGLAREANTANEMPLLPPPAGPANLGPQPGNGTMPAAFLFGQETNRKKKSKRTAADAQPDPSRPHVQGLTEQDNIFSLFPNYMD